MRIAYTTTFDGQDVHNWSGTPYHMSHALQQAGMDVEYVGKLKRKTPSFFKLKQVWGKYVADKRESPRFNIYAAKSFSEQAARQLKNTAFDAIVSPLINPIAYLETKQPIILWTDALYSSLVGFYPPFNYHSANTIKQGNAMTQACLDRCALALFSSDWAANSAIELYGIQKEKVKVVPFGANLTSYPSLEDVKTFISQRPQNKIKLLFLAKSWERKGGDIVLAVAKALHQAGHPIELNIVGYTPKITEQLPFVNYLGFVSKHTAEGKKQLEHLLSASHFLFVPSRAEAYGIVFCEANAYGVPCLTTHVGGIGTIVKDDLNGMTFGLDASIQTYCDYVVNVMSNRQRYEELALASYNEFVTRLNWQVAAKRVKGLIEGL